LLRFPDGIGGTAKSPPLSTWRGAPAGGPFGFPYRIGGMPKSPPLPTWRGTPAGGPFGFPYRIGGAAELTLVTILPLVPGRGATLAISESLQCMDSTLSTRRLDRRARPVSSGSGLAVMRGERVSGSLLARKRPELTKKYREWFHTENIPGVGHK
jgi:hypothetical protein